MKQVVLVRNPWKWWSVRAIISAIIRWRYNSWSNHIAFVYIDPKDGKKYVIESDTPYGVTKVLFEEWYHKDKILKFYDHQFSIKAAEWYIGKVAYDYRSIFKHLLNWYHWRKRRNTIGEQTCYEFFATVLHLPNEHKFRPIDAEKYLEEHENNL